MIEGHGGRLSASSKGLGEGSTFTIILPRLDRQRLGDARTAGGDAAQTRLQRVLVVDDDQDFASTMAHLLQMLGHDARTAYGFHQGMEVAEAFEPEVVLVDPDMPDGDGFELAKRLRERLADRLFIAAMTGYDLEERPLNTRQAGFDAHLTKPVALEDLQALLQRPGRGQ
jgi:CheY-like chemotaxis protein